LHKLAFHGGELHPDYQIARGAVQPPPRAAGIDATTRYRALSENGGSSSRSYDQRGGRSQVARTYGAGRRTGMIRSIRRFQRGATVGGVVASNTSGPRRRLYGTARDLVIGMQFATVEGKLCKPAAWW